MFKPQFIIIKKLRGQSKSFVVLESGRKVTKIQVEYINNRILFRLKDL
jgi:hypothetical protein